MGQKVEERCRFRWTCYDVQQNENSAILLFGNNIFKIQYRMSWILNFFKIHKIRILVQWCLALPTSARDQDHFPLYTEIKFVILHIYFLYIQNQD